MQRWFRERSCGIAIAQSPAAEVRLIKLGKRLAVGDVQIYCDGEDAMVAHATSTYSIPPPEQRKA